MYDPYTDRYFPLGYGGMPPPPPLQPRKRTMKEKCVVWCKTNKLYIYWTLGVLVALVVIDRVFNKGKGVQAIVDKVKGK
jgi:hypothetical protein